MQRLFNDPAAMVDEAIAGFVKSHQAQVERTSCGRTLKCRFAPVPGRVGVVSGGGAGHDPAFIGYLGKNMLDAVAIGDIFTSPSPFAFYTAFKEADSGAGVLCIYGNYPKDRECVEEAIAIARKDGIKVSTVVVNEDIATPDPETRRGMTGEVLLWKIGGGAASLAYDLPGVTQICERALRQTRSIGVGLSSCIIPAVGKSNYTIEPGTMEIGVGHHGFSSKDTCKLKTANETADIMLGEILKEMPLTKGERIAVMLSGLGGTMQSELNILYSRISDVLEQDKITVHQSFVGNYFTSLDMIGVTLTIMKLDDELANLMDIPAYPVAISDFAADAQKWGVEDESG